MNKLDIVVEQFRAINVKQFKYWTPTKWRVLDSKSTNATGLKV